MEAAVPVPTETASSGEQPQQYGQPSHGLELAPTPPSSSIIGAAPSDASSAPSSQAQVTVAMNGSPAVLNAPSSPVLRHNPYQQPQQVASPQQHSYAAQFQHALQMPHQGSSSSASPLSPQVALPTQTPSVVGVGGGIVPVLPTPALPLAGLLPTAAPASPTLMGFGAGTMGNGLPSAPEPLDRCNVFVKYLPPDMRDEGLLELFSGCGRITSCKVMLDHKTHTSLGYGFVRFSTAEEALKTIEKMSGYQVGSKTLLCKLSNCSPAPAQTPCNNLYVKPLLPDTTEEQLRALFSVYGRVEECRVMLDKRTGRSRQIGFVRFSMLHEATNALKRMNGARISPDSLPLIVKYAETDAQKAARRARKLAAQNAAVRAATTPYFPFPTQGLGVSQFPYMPQPMGLPGAMYPSVAMTPYFPPGHGIPALGHMAALPHAAMAYTPALAPYPASALYGHQPSVHQAAAAVAASAPYYAQQQQNAYASGAGNLFVFHLPSDIDDARLAQLFSPFGEVESVKVMSDKATGESKGYGFVKFYRMADAVNAISYMNGYAIGSKHLKVTFKTPTMRI